MENSLNGKFAAWRKQKNKKTSVLDFAAEMHSLTNSKLMALKTYGKDKMFKNALE